jgi:hypothetical protein
MERLLELRMINFIIYYWMKGLIYKKLENFSFVMNISSNKSEQNIKINRVEYFMIHF